MPTKETKNNLLEKQMSHLLKGLHEAKRKGALSFTSSFECIEMLNDGIKALENTQFASVDDFDSVKEGLVFNLHNLNRWYFSEGKIDYVDYKTRALQAINESRPILEQHRGYKQILGNLVLFILTAGTAFLIHKACTGHFLFFKQTESAKQLDALTQTFNTLSLSQKSY